MKNRCIRWLVSLWNLWRKPSKEPTFLIVSTTGLGDTLWATPAVRALRETHPKAYIALLTSPIGEEVFRHNPHLSEIFVLKNSSLLSLMLLFPRLKREKFGTIFIFHASHRAVFPFCHLLGAAEIIGTAGNNKDLDFILTKILAKKVQHEIVRRLDIVSVPADKPFLELFIDAADKEEVEEFFHQQEISPYLPLIALHPGAKDGFKQWPKEHFIALGKRLVDAIGCQIFVSGNKKEQQLVEDITNNIPGAIALCENFSVRSFAAFLHKLDLFITNDTGPMHIAFAMNAKVVALFSPTDPKLCGPYLATCATIIHKPPTCAPCSRKRCREPFCLLQIGPDEVFEAALEKMGLQQIGNAPCPRQKKRKSP